MQEESTNEYVRSKAAYALEEIGTPEAKEAAGRYLQRTMKRQ
jgi:hypothetical protein